MSSPEVWARLFGVGMLSPEVRGRLFGVEMSSPEIPARYSAMWRIEFLTIATFSHIGRRNFVALLANGYLNLFPI